MNLIPFTEKLGNTESVISVEKSIWEKSDFSIED